MSEQRERPFSSEWLSNALLLAGAAGVAFLIWSLAAENRALKQEIAELRVAAAVPENLLAAGDTIANTPVRALDGHRGAMRELLGGGGVIAYLTTTCPYCEQTLPIWGEVAAQFQARGLPFIGLSLHDEVATRAYAERHDLEWPLWVIDNPVAAMDLNVQSVPFTVLVGGGGQVERVWLGALARPDAGDLLAAAESLFPDAISSLSRSLAEDPSCCAGPTFGTDGGR